MASIAQLVSEFAHSVGQPNNYALRENIKSLIIHTRNEIIRRSYENHNYVDSILKQRFKVSLIDIIDGDGKDTHIVPTEPIHIKESIEEWLFAKTTTTTNTLNEDSHLGVEFEYYGFEEAYYELEDFPNIKFLHSINDDIRERYMDENGLLWSDGYAKFAIPNYLNNENVNTLDVIIRAIQGPVVNVYIQSVKEGKGTLENPPYRLSSVVSKNNAKLYEYTIHLTRDMIEEQPNKDYWLISIEGITSMPPIHSIEIYANKLENVEEDNSDNISKIDKYGGFTPIKRTAQKVPRPVRLTNNLPFDRVSTVGFKTNREIPYIKETSAQFRSFLPGMCGTPAYDYINEYLYFFPPDNKAMMFDKVVIEAAFEHPTEIQVNEGEVSSWDAEMDANEWLLSEDMIGQIKDIIYKRDLLNTIRENNEIPNALKVNN